MRLSRLSNLDCINAPAVIAPAASSTVEPAATHVHFRAQHTSHRCRRWAATRLARRSLEQLGRRGGHGSRHGTRPHRHGGHRTRRSRPHSSIAGAALACLACDLVAAGVTQISSGSGVRPHSSCRRPLTSAPAVSQSILDASQLLLELSHRLARVSDSSQATASAAPTRNFSKASKASNGPAEISDWLGLMLNINLGLGNAA